MCYNKHHICIFDGQSVHDNKSCTQRGRVHMTMRELKTALSILLAHVGCSAETLLYFCSVCVADPFQLRIYSHLYCKVS